VRNARMPGAGRFPAVGYRSSAGILLRRKAAFHNATPWLAVIHNGKICSRPPRFATKPRAAYLGPFPSHTLIYFGTLPARQAGSLREYHPRCTYARHEHQIN
jgi:hypothetical protein